MIRSYDEIAADAREGAAFSNGSEFSIWAFTRCDRCKNADMGGCAITDVAIVERTTPAEWTGERGSYECREFEPMP